jgi:hypothetical protein
MLQMSPLPPSGLKALQNFRSLHAEIFYPIKGLPFQTKMLHYFRFLVTTSRRGEIYNRIRSVPGRYLVRRVKSGSIVHVVT